MSLHPVKQTTVVCLVLRNLLTQFLYGRIGPHHTDDKLGQYGKTWPIQKKLVRYDSSRPIRLVMAPSVVSVLAEFNEDFSII